MSKANPTSEQELRARVAELERRLDLLVKALDVFCETMTSALSEMERSIVERYGG